MQLEGWFDVCKARGTAMESLRHLLLSVLSVMIVATAVSAAWALDPGRDGWYVTGDGVRIKRVAFVSVKVYAISHATKKLPDSKSKQAMIDLDADKRFTWRMLRDVDAERIRGALTEAYALNGYRDAAKINAFVGAFTHELKDGATVTIAYDANGKSTTIRVSGDGMGTVPGTDFMRATWSLWFGKIDQPELGDALLAKL